MQLGGGSLMFWECSGACGAEGFIFIERRMNSGFYSDIFQKTILESIKVLERLSIYQHNNGPKQTSNVATNVLSYKEAKTLSWSTIAPDLRSIDHLWFVRRGKNS